MNAQSEVKSLPTFFSTASLAASLVAALSIGAPGAPALAGDWIVGAKSQARLIEGGTHQGARYAGVQIRLAGEALTYWRDPGDSGVPPTFDFAGSENVATADVVYPEPDRIAEESGQAFGYRHEVLFPIRVAPDDPAKPVVLALKLDYAVCEKICIPVHAQMDLVLPPQPQAPETALLDEALARVPRVLDGEQTAGFASVAPAPPAAGKPQWRVTINGEARDLFIEPPAGFFFDVRPESKNVFLFTLAQHPGKRMRPEAPLRLTATGPAPVEFDLALPPRN